MGGPANSPASIAFINSKPDFCSTSSGLGRSAGLLAMRRVLMRLSLLGGLAHLSPPPKATQALRYVFQPHFGLHPQRMAHIPRQFGAVEGVKMQPAYAFIHQVAAQFGAQRRRQQFGAIVAGGFF